MFRIELGSVDFRLPAEEKSCGAGKRAATFQDAGDCSESGEDSLVQSGDRLQAQNPPTGSDLIAPVRDSVISSRRTP